MKRATLLCLLAITAPVGPVPGGSCLDSHANSHSLELSHWLSIEWCEVERMKLDSYEGVPRGLSQGMSPIEMVNAS